MKIQFTDTHVKLENIAGSKKKNRQKIDTARAFYGELREAPAGKFKDTPNIAEAASIARLDKWNEDKEREAKRKDYAGDMEKVMREYCAV